MGDVLVKRFEVLHFDDGFTAGWHKGIKVNINLFLLLVQLQVLTRV